MKTADIKPLESHPGRSFVDELLAEQSRLTIVEKFAREHASACPASAPRSYRDLIPLSAPPPGHQFAFEVDLDKCSGCKACVTACHALNGLEDNEAWRDAGLLVSDDWRRPFQQTITTACHHCVDPACSNGCPVLAYEKDPVTGIVRHLDDQCIGCQYCVMMCPYEVPQYSERKGIVRKCDMCSQRLLAGEAPACVQACPSEAIRIDVVSKDALSSELRGAGATWLPAAPNPAISVPSTRYVSNRALPQDLIPADATHVRLQPAHWPLVFMLVLTQLGAGALLLLPLLSTLVQPALALLAMAATFLGLAGSVLHLGKPLKAWRSFLGLRRSWMSREIAAFALLVPLMTATTQTLRNSEGNSALLWATAIVGLIAVVCSGMIYHKTQRAFWHGVRSIGRFLGTTLVLGFASAWFVAEAAGSSLSWILVALALVMTMKLSGEHRMLRRAGTDQKSWPDAADFDEWSLAQSAVLMRDALGSVTRWRFFCGAVGGVALPLVSFVADGSGVLLVAASFALCVAGEFAERLMFFRAVVPPRMPGAA